MEQYQIHRQRFSYDEIVSRHEEAKAQREVDSFLRRVRLPLSGFVAALCSRLEAWRAARVERRAQVCFERGLV